MANVFQTQTTGAAILKRFYQGPLQSQFNDDLNIWRAAQKADRKFTGQFVVRPLKVRRNQGVGAVAEGANLPQTGIQTNVDAQIYAKYVYARTGITAQMIKASQNDAGAFVRDSRYEIEESYLDLKSDVNRMLTWDGTGDLATVNTTVVASTSVSLAGRESTEAALKFLDVGARVDIYTSAGVLVQSGLTINSISSGNNSTATATVVFDQAVSASSGDVLVRAGSFGNEIQGLLTQLDGLTTTVFNIPRATYKQTQGIALSNGNAALSLDFIQSLQDGAESNGGGMGMNSVYSDFPTRRMYNKLLVADKRYVNSMKGDGGFSDKDKSYLTYNEMPWIADRDCPTRIFMLPGGMLEKYVLQDLEIANESGSDMIADPNVDQYEIRIRLFANMFNAKAAASACGSSYVSP